jgi:hypothetical protein
VPFRASGAIADGGDVVQFEISADRQHVVFRADRVVDERYELYRVPITGGTPTKLSGTMPSFGDVSPAWAISPGSSTVAFLADLDVDELVELFDVTSSGGTPERLNGPMTPGRAGRARGLRPDERRPPPPCTAPTRTSRVASSSNRVSTTGRRRREAQRPVAGGVRSFRLTRQGPSRALYVADQDENLGMELYAVPTDGSEPPGAAEPRDVEQRGRRAVPRDVRGLCARRLLDLPERRTPRAGHRARRRAASPRGS